MVNFYLNSNFKASTTHANLAKIIIRKEDQQEINGIYSLIITTSNINSYYTLKFIFFQKSNFNISNSNEISNNFNLVENLQLNTNNLKSVYKAALFNLIVSKNDLIKSKSIFIIINVLNSNNIDEDMVTVITDSSSNKNILKFKKYSYLGKEIFQLEMIKDENNNNLFSYFENEENNFKRLSFSYNTESGNESEILVTIYNKEILLHEGFPFTMFLDNSIKNKKEEEKNRLIEFIFPLIKGSSKDQLNNDLTINFQDILNDYKAITKLYIDFEKLKDLNYAKYKYTLYNSFILTLSDYDIKRYNINNLNSLYLYIELSKETASLFFSLTINHLNNVPTFIPLGSSFKDSLCSGCTKTYYTILDDNVYTSSHLRKSELNDLKLIGFVKENTNVLDINEMFTSGSYIYNDLLYYDSLRKSVVYEVNKKEEDSSNNSSKNKYMFVSVLNNYNGQTLINNNNNQLNNFEIDLSSNYLNIELDEVYSFSLSEALLKNFYFKIRKEDILIKQKMENKSKRYRVYFIFEEHYFDLSKAYNLQFKVYKNEISRKDNKNYMKEVKIVKGTLSYLFFEENFSNNNFYGFNIEIDKINKDLKDLNELFSFQVKVVEDYISLDGLDFSSIEQIALIEKNEETFCTNFSNLLVKEFFCNLVITNYDPYNLFSIFLVYDDNSNLNYSSKDMIIEYIVVEQENMLLKELHINDFNNFFKLDKEINKKDFRSFYNINNLGVIINPEYEKKYNRPVLLIRIKLLNKGVYKVYTQENRRHFLKSLSLTLDKPFLTLMDINTQESISIPSSEDNLVFNIKGLYFGESNIQYSYNNHFDKIDLNSEDSKILIKRLYNTNSVSNNNINNIKIYNDGHNPILLLLNLEKKRTELVFLESNSSTEKYFYTYNNNDKVKFPLFYAFKMDKNEDYTVNIDFNRNINTIFGNNNEIINFEDINIKIKGTTFSNLKDLESNFKLKDGKLNADLLFEHEGSFDLSLLNVKLSFI